MENGIIQKFSAKPNIYLSLVPFSTTANAPNPLLLDADETKRHLIYEAQNSTENEKLVELAGALTANGGTRIGDGLVKAKEMIEAMAKDKPANKNIVTE